MRASPGALTLIALAACAGPAGDSSAPPAGASPAAAPLPAAPAEEQGPGLAAWAFLCARYDRDGDGVITAVEHTRAGGAFERLDADHDGRITPADFAEEWEGVPRVERFSYGEGGPEFGDAAPPFRLAATDGGTVELAAFRGKKAVALAFGSFT